MGRRIAEALIAVLGASLAGCGGGTSTAPPGPPPPPVDVTTYSNPLRITIASGGLVEDCPDPTIIHSQRSGDAN